MRALRWRRAFWVVASPAVWIGWKLGLWGYQWVNVATGARYPQSFDALWQHRWYGAPLDTMPERVVLGGVGFRVSVSEGVVVFTDDLGMGNAGRITFERDPHDKYAWLWYVEVRGRVTATYVTKGYEWVRAVFGGSHEIRRAALKRNLLAGREATP